jgi:hypothetical protein
MVDSFGHEMQTLAFCNAPLHLLDNLVNTILLAAVARRLRTPDRIAIPPCCRWSAFATDRRRGS